MTSRPTSYACHIWMCGPTSDTIWDPACNFKIAFIYFFLLTLTCDRLTSEAYRSCATEVGIPAESSGAEQSVCIHSDCIFIDHLQTRTKDIPVHFQLPRTPSRFSCLFYGLNITVSGTFIIILTGWLCIVITIASFKSIYFITLLLTTTSSNEECTSSGVWRVFAMIIVTFDLLSWQQQLYSIPAWNWTSHYVVVLVCVNDRSAVTLNILIMHRTIGLTH